MPDQAGPFSHSSPPHAPPTKPRLRLKSSAQSPVSTARKRTRPAGVNPDSPLTPPRAYAPGARPGQIEVQKTQQRCVWPCLGIVAAAVASFRRTSEHVVELARRQRRQVGQHGWRRSRAGTGTPIWSDIDSTNPETRLPVFSPAGSGVFSMVASMPLSDLPHHRQADVHQQPERAFNAGVRSGCAQRCKAVKLRRMRSWRITARSKYNVQGSVAQTDAAFSTVWLWILASRAGRPPGVARSR
jgi:hypothetical protein